MKEKEKTVEKGKRKNIPGTMTSSKLKNQAMKRTRKKNKKKEER